MTSKQSILTSPNCQYIFMYGNLCISQLLSIYSVVMMMTMMMMSSITLMRPEGHATDCVYSRCQNIKVH